MKKTHFNQILVLSHLKSQVENLKAIASALIETKAMISLLLLINIRLSARSSGMLEREGRSRQRNSLAKEETKKTSQVSITNYWELRSKPGR